MYKSVPPEKPSPLAFAATLGPPLNELSNDDPAIGKSIDDVKPKIKSSPLSAETRLFGVSEPAPPINVEYNALVPSAENLVIPTSTTPPEKVIS